MNDDYLAHHGIKGQKWGIRRYQNSDGSLTDEGRRRYGYGRGAGGLMTQNTADKMRKGARIGARVGAGAGVLATAATVGLAGATAGSLALVNPAIVMGIGASYVAECAAGGALRGAAIGGIIGAVDTKKGRAYIEKYDKGLRDFEMRDLYR